MDPKADAQSTGSDGRSTNLKRNYACLDLRQYAFRNTVRRPGLLATEDEVGDKNTNDSKESVPRLDEKQAHESHHEESDRS